jgi:hypothetical protein
MLVGQARLRNPRYARLDGSFNRINLSTSFSRVMVSIFIVSTLCCGSGIRMNERCPRAKKQEQART